MPSSPTALRKAHWQSTIFVAGLVAFLLLDVGLSALSYERFHREAETNADNLAEAIRLAVEETIGRAESYMLGVSSSLKSGDFSGGLTKQRHDEIESLMASHLTRFPEISNYQVFTAGGDYILGAGNAEATRLNFSDREWFRSLKDDPAKALAISEVIVGNGPAARTVVVAVPIRGTDGHLLGAVNAVLDLSHMQRLIDGPEIGAKGVISLRRSDTARLMLRRPEIAGMINRPVSSAFAARIFSGEMSGVMDFVYSVDNVARTTAFSRTQHYPLVVVVGLARDDYLRPWVIQTLIAWNMTLVFVVMLGLLYFRQQRTQKILEAARSESQLHAHRYEVLLNSASEGICGVDAEGLVDFINPAAQRILGWREDEVVGTNFHILAHRNHFHADGIGYPASDCKLHSTLSRPGTGSDGTERQFNKDVYWRKDGTAFQVEYRVATIRGEGEASGAAILFRDVTERKKKAEQARHLLFYDALTNLPKRRLFNDRFSLVIAAGKRSGCRGAIMFLVLDQFKAISDLYGHTVVDLLLIETADRLKACIRDMDTVARFGRGEFVVMISELDADKSVSLAQAGSIAEKIRGALSGLYVLTVQSPETGGTAVELRCTASVGVALFGDLEASQDDIFTRAVTAMFQARKEGHNSVRFYDG